MFPNNLQKKLSQRHQTSGFRKLKKNTDLIDFTSNDYLGFSKNPKIFYGSHKLLIDNGLIVNGSTGSRLLTGNFDFIDDLENEIAKLHQVESALLFCSGYTANLGLFSAILTRGTVVLYDSLIHASIRDGIGISDAKSYKFKHNSCEDLARLLEKFKGISDDIYVVTESVFSMDGDTPNLVEILNLCDAYKAHLIVDEAHAFGVFSLGIVQNLGLAQRVFARIITYGKALGVHGAVVLGSELLKNYLVNFSRAFIYTTGIPPHQVATIKIAYQELLNDRGTNQVKILQKLTDYFLTVLKQKHLNFIPSTSAIQCCVVNNPRQAKELSNFLKEHNYDVKAILSPTVEKGKERLRFCLHSFNTKNQILTILNLLELKMKDIR